MSWEVGFLVGPVWQRRLLGFRLIGKGAVHLEPLVFIICWKFSFAVTLANEIFLGICTVRRFVVCILLDLPISEEEESADGASQSQDTYNYTDCNPGSLPA